VRTSPGLDHEIDAILASDDRWLPVRRDPLRDHVVSVAAQGEPNGWHHTSPSGMAVISRFCGNCGTRLYGERDGRPEIVSLRAGTLDDTSWLVPVAHFFTRSAQPWVQPEPGAQCFETQPNGWGSLLPAWRAMWPEFFPKS
jgi:hypothetical protein